MENHNLIFMPATARHEDVLWHMLTYAATMSKKTDLAIALAKADPYLRTYAEGFGMNEGDLGIVAEHACGLAVGAAWLRTSHIEGSMRVSSSDTPELAMGLLPECRGRGIGTKLLEVLPDTASVKYSTIVLSVREENLACRMCLRFGFVETGRIKNRVGGDSISMQLALNSHHPNV